jgi:hypothetical protein
MLSVVDAITHRPPSELPKLLMERFSAHIQALPARRSAATQATARADRPCLPIEQSRNLFHQRALARDGGNMANLIVLGSIVYVTYCFLRITAYCALWLIGALSFKQRDGSLRPRPPRVDLPAFFR